MTTLAHVQTKKKSNAIQRSTHAGYAKPHHPQIKTLLGRQNVQAKLKVGPANDKYEQEADRVAEQVVQTATHTQPSAPAIQRKCSGCEQEEETVQRKGENNGSGETDTAMPGSTESYIHSLRGGGSPLSESERSFYEPRFGQNFEQVRVHTGNHADQAAKSIGARAFTVGNDIAFANGEYQPGSNAGRQLLAHELTHTIQQSQQASPTRSTVQRGSAGIFGGKCCNSSPGEEWALVGDGEWKKLKEDECTGTLEDCDGMTCGGGFYFVDNLQKGSCVTPRKDDATFAPRRWTPTKQAPKARSPKDEGSTQGNTPPGYKYDAAESTGTPKFQVGGDTTSKKIIRIAWTFDDGPTSQTSPMQKAVGLDNVTWFVMLNQIKGKNATEEAANIAELQAVQNKGGEIAIHAYHPSKSHVAWFPMSTHDSYSDVDVSMGDLEKFHKYLTAAKIIAKFVRLPYGLMSELVQWLKDKSVANPSTTAREIIKKSYSGTDKGALEVKAGFEKMLKKLAALKLHLWGGSGGTKDEVAALSWEAESSGVSSRADNITKHVSADRAANPASASDNAGKFERVTDLVAKDSKARSLIVLAHDTTAKDVTEVSSDKSTMETYAKSKGVKIEYYTLTELYKVLRGKAP